MPSLARAQISFPLFAATSGQHATNTLYFSDSPGVNNAIDAPVSNTTRASIAAKIPAAWGTLTSILSANLVNPGTLTIYDLFDPEPRVPIYQEEFSSSKTTSMALPSEVAVVLSYNTVFASGTPRARKRGRIYLGPVPAASATAGTSALPSRPGGSYTTALNAFWDVLSDVTTYPDSSWVQYSPTTGLFGFVVEASYDDAWDTQRRRGAPATARVELTP